MPVSPLRLIKNSMEFVPQSGVNQVPPRTRGLYVLYKHNARSGSYDVVYVGMARGERSGIAGNRRAPESENTELHYASRYIPLYRLY